MFLRPLGCMGLDPRSASILLRVVVSGVILVGLPIRGRLIGIMSTMKHFRVKLLVGYDIPLTTSLLRIMAGVFGPTAKGIF